MTSDNRLRWLLASGHRFASRIVRDLHDFAGITRQQITLVLVAAGIAAGVMWPSSLGLFWDVVYPILMTSVIVAALVLPDTVVAEGVEAVERKPLFWSVFWLISTFWIVAYGAGGRWSAGFRSVDSWCFELAMLVLMVRDDGGGLPFVQRVWRQLVSLVKAPNTAVVPE